MAVELADQVSTKVQKAGDSFNLRLAEPLIVSGRIVLPAGTPGAFRVFYDGKPLPKAKVEIGTEFGWRRELKTDDKGAVEVELPWKGTYVIEVTVMDATPGVHGSEPYDTMRFVTTLAFRAPAGLEAPPRPPVTTPKRY